MANVEVADHSTGQVSENHSSLPGFFEDVYKKGLAYTEDWQHKAVLAAPVMAVAAAVVVTKGRVLEEAAAAAVKDGAADIAPAAETLIGQAGKALTGATERASVEKMDAGAMRSMLKAKGLVSESTDAQLMDGSKVLHLEPQYGGADLSKSSHIVAEVASDLQRPVKFNFSGVRSAVTPGDSGATVEAGWRAAWKAKSNTPEALEADRLLVERFAAQDARRAATNHQAVVERVGEGARGEAELIKSLKAGGGDGHWMQFALKSLGHPEEMTTAVNYYARESPDVAARNLEFALSSQKWIKPGTENFWRDAVAQMKVLPKS